MRLLLLVDILEKVFQNSLIDPPRRQGIAKQLPTNRDARRADRKRRREDSESDEELRDPLPGKCAARLNPWTTDLSVLTSRLLH